jgi:hypothetical protein
MDKIVFYTAVNSGSNHNRNLTALIQSATNSYYGLQMLFNTYFSLSKSITEKIDEQIDEQINNEEFNSVNDNSRGYLTTDIVYLLSQSKYQPLVITEQIVNLLLLEMNRLKPVYDKTSIFLLTYEIPNIFFYLRKLTVSPKTKSLCSMLFIISFLIIRFPITFLYCYKYSRKLKQSSLLSKIFYLYLFMMSMIWMKKIIQRH